jgi:hypothetical protein
MTLPVVDRIAEVIRSRVNPVAPDRANGVGQAAVVMPMRHIPELASLVIQQQPTRFIPELDCPGNPPAVCLETIFAINCFVKNGESEQEFTQQCNSVVADVVSAITTPSVDPAMWYTFGGIALDADIGISRSLLTDAGTSCGMTVPLTVRYRVAENDHTISR